ncbi:hypothetical protein BU26DRAFT_440413 [Trematosphaeria pertusa]|uniref:Uncharacterized protein n=1 Tax=Trematosphaeria pertusa TaxID=390896 RepID=A0A6A6HU63_9PLEO|nr:uncharacterized protein BU26DRAFT_440413 [Trematosphaeria pertusa]KAF2241551.1 hypothetical protein BU26DRAFT_440413 [Trematosphaeria pertusa]
MDQRAQDDTRDLGDVVSLTSLENDADDFDRLMIQNARDERRLNDALQGKVQPFRKARTHPRVGVTLENLERHNARNNAALGANAHVKFESPPSSSGSVRSDPAIQVPAGWGRKARVKRHWMRTITSDDEQTPGARGEGIERPAEDDEKTPRRADSPADADVPRPSIEDSPLSHKSSRHGTPSSSRQQRIEDWDFDLNEASIIASTPYIPRNTALDDIRQREIESLREQGVTTNRLGKIRKSSPEELRRPRSSSARSTLSQPNGTSTEQETQGAGSSELRLRKRTNSWQTIDKSQVVNGEGVENSPIIVYKKSSETVGAVDPGLLASAQSNSKRPSHHRREDSQDLLRRLARVSSQTPSPGRVTTGRPQTAPARQPDSSSQTMVTERSPTPPGAKNEACPEEAARESTAQTDAIVPEGQPQQDQNSGDSQQHTRAPESTQAQRTDDIDATPMPVEQSILNPKTPVVTGAWVDTPRPATVHRPTEQPRPSSQSPKKGSPRKSPEKRPTLPEEETPEPLAPETTRPTLPRSALEAIVEEAKANGKRRPDDFGDSTINSLEDLLAPVADETGDMDEDTLQGLQLPTRTPRNEAERQRQQELLHLHRMNERLRAARTSIRDASRGMKRVENRVEHVEDMVTEGGERIRIIYKECPCMANGGHQCLEFSMWRWFKSLFYDERLKPRRRGWGLTMLSICLIAFFTWFVAENAACEAWCHHLYAKSYKGYGVTYDAPEFPFVIPTMTYRAFIKPWWIPLFGFLAWGWRTLAGCLVGGEETVQGGTARATATRVATKMWEARRAWEAEGGGERVLGMGADEVVR